MLRQEQQNVIDECLRRGHGGVCLPLGYGKTLIGLELGKTIKERYYQDFNHKIPTLIVCSKNLIGNWIEHIVNFYPKSIYYFYHNSNKDVFNLEELDYLLTTPETLSRHYDEVRDDFCIVDSGYTRYITPMDPLSDNELNMFYNIIWNCLIIDEIHLLSNINTAKCQAISALCVRHRYGLSGTIIDNIHPNNILGYYKLIGDTSFPTSIENTKAVIMSDNFKGLKHTCIIRTADSYVVDYDEIIIESDPSDIEIKLYNTFISIIKKLFEILRNLERERRRNNNESEDRRNDTMLLNRYRQYLIASIVYIRQMAVSPLIPYAKAAVNSVDISNRSQLAELINAEITINNLSEIMNDERNIYSTRIISCLNQLEVNKDRVIIFSAFRVTLNLLAYCIRQSLPNRLVMSLESDMSVNERSKTLNDFKDKEGSILLLTYSCGSVGLNLQCSNVVYILDHSWSSISTKQAIQRVVRRGQEKKCFIYYFASSLSIEEAILNKQISKLDIAKGIFQGNQEMINSSQSSLHINKIIENLINNFETNQKIKTISSKLSELHNDE